MVSGLKDKSLFVKTIVISLFNHVAFHHLVEIPSMILIRFLFVKRLYETS